MLILGSDVLSAVLWSMLAPLGFLPVVLPFMYGSTHPLVIYQRGFDAPVSILKFAEARKRFVAFTTVRKIHPKYASLLGTTSKCGLTFLASGRKVDIYEARADLLKAIEAAFKHAMQDAWDARYSEIPYFGKVELQRISAQLGRSKASVWTEALIIILVCLALVAWAVTTDPGFYLTVVVGLVSLTGMFVGIVRLQFYYNALAKFSEAIKADPSLERYLQPFTLRKVKKELALEVVKDFTDVQWRLLAKRAYNKWVLLPFFPAFVLIIVGFAAIASFDFGRNPIEAFWLFFGFPAFAITGLAYFAGRKIWRSLKILEEIVEEELKQGRRILPEWFDVKTGFLQLSLYRDPPRLTDSQWETLVAASEMRGRGLRLVFVLLMFFGGVMAFVSFLMVRTYGYICAIPGFVMIAIFGVLFMAWSIKISKLQAIEAYEEHSGRKVIPEQYRARIMPWDKRR